MLVISYHICNRLSNLKSKLLNTNKNLIDASDNKMVVIGIVQLPVKIMGTKVVKSIEFCVVNSNYSYLIG